MVLHYADLFPDLEELGIDFPVAPPGPCRVLTIGVLSGGMGRSTITACLASFTAYGFYRSHSIEREALLGRRPIPKGGYLRQVTNTMHRRLLPNQEQVKPRRVLVIDLDPKGDQWRILNIGDPPQYSLYDVFQGRRDVEDCILRSDSNPHLHLLPATRKLEDLEFELMSSFREEDLLALISEIAAMRTDGTLPAQEAELKRLIVRKIDEAIERSSRDDSWLRSIIEPLRKKYDRIYIDAPRSPALTMQALVASDEALCVCEATAKGFAKIEPFLELVDLARKQNKQLWPVGILLTRVKRMGRTTENLFRMVANRHQDLLLPRHVEQNSQIAQLWETGVSVRSHRIRSIFGEVLAEIFAREVQYTARG